MTEIFLDAVPKIVRVGRFPVKYAVVVSDPEDHPNVSRLWVTRTRWGARRIARDWLLVSIHKYD